MTQISGEELITWNQEGLIPGPTESEEEYLKRVEFCLRLKQQLTKELGTTLPFQESDLASQTIFESAWKKTFPLFGIRPSWVPLFFSNVKLTPWHGGCAWIFQLNEKAPLAGLLQLRKSFATQSIFTRMYQRDELIAHELAHVGRMCYQEPKYEEFFAYQTSASWLRRTLGPIVQSSYESLIFVFALVFVLFFDLWMLLAEQSPNTLTAWAIKLIPIAMLAYAGARLAKRWQTLKKARKVLLQIVANEELADQVLYRLTDHEIESFANMNGGEIQDYFESHQTQSLRLKMIQELYFAKKSG
jgi:hypothetical protein